MQPLFHLNCSFLLIANASWLPPKAIHHPRDTERAVLIAASWLDQTCQMVFVEEGLSLLRGFGCAAAGQISDVLQAVSALPQLAKLDFYNQHLTGMLPSNISFPRLTELRLVNNDISVCFTRRYRDALMHRALEMH